MYTVDLGSIDSAGQEPYVSWLEVPPKNTFYVQEVTCGKLLHVPDAPKYESSREDKMTTPNCTYSLVYERTKYLHECSHCGFEANLYESEYECPICKTGTMCRTAQNTLWIGQWGSGDSIPSLSDAWQEGAGCE